MSGTNYRPKVAAVVLAAGDSKRIAGIKQLMPWKGTTLLGYVLAQLKQTDASAVFLVLGAYKNEIMKVTDTSGVSIIDNEDWPLGMGTSLSKAVSFLKDCQQDFDGLLVAVVDQPLLDISHYNKLINSCINRNRIITSYYDQTPGVPTVFGTAYFGELSLLSADKGAKSIIKKHLKHLIYMDAPLGVIDLDTMEQYQKYYQSHGNQDR